jgi:SAM-dependent methyltransferase
MMSVALDEFKQRQRAMWAAGDYPTVSEQIAGVGELLVEWADVRAGVRVLDVACGSGNAAFPAARKGAGVTALDLVPELLEAGRTKAARMGLEIEWIEGDAESLPFDDASFDRVLSTFGHMFAPRHRPTVDEMMRVCRQGGILAICCWTPEGVTGDVFRASAAYLPPPPEFASPPRLWGTEEHVREMFGPVAKRFEFERHSATIEWDSVEGWADYFLDRFGPLVTARQTLGDRFRELRAEIVAAWESRNEVDDGRLLLPQEYLLAVAHV